ncbi:MAG: class I SAM-dependent methyltransferase [Steroidobacteraceae bacterium]
MNTHNPIDLLFGGMKNLGPGSDADTLHVLRLLPKREFQVIVDAGCGTGRQSLALARALNSVVHAIDSYQPFLIDARRHAREASLDHLVQTHCMDMKDIPETFHDIDLLWSEGGAYNIGFSNALKIWAPAIRRNAFAVVNELAWLRDEVPDEVREFFLAGYPDMQSVPQILAVAEGAGFKVLNTYTLPRQAWVADYYDILEPRAKSLAAHSDSAVRELASETLREIKAFRVSEDSYGYVFLVLQRT